MYSACPSEGQAEHCSLVGGPKDVAWAHIAPRADAAKRLGRDCGESVAFDRAGVISE
ncbi:hypothetical protein GCM10028832_35010 [Streptomyces sparsus]